MDEAAQLHAATVRGDADQVTQILTKDPELVDVCEERGSSALHEVSYGGSVCAVGTHIDDHRT